jgi:hypothetical protein
MSSARPHDNGHRSTSQIDDALFFAEPLPPDDRLRLIVRLWLSLPVDHWAAPTDTERADLERKLATGDLRALGNVPWRALARPQVQVPRKPPAKLYSAPRRFDLFTIMIVTTAYAVLLGGVSVLGMPPIASAYVAAFITIVGIGQAILFGGRRPRLASVISGISAFFVLSMLSFATLDGRFHIDGPLETIAFSVLWSLYLGSLLGYIAGVLVGGVFLVTDVVRRRYGQVDAGEPWAEADAAQPSAIAPDPTDGDLDRP